MLDLSLFNATPSARGVVHGAMCRHDTCGKLSVLVYIGDPLTDAKQFGPVLCKHCGVECDGSEWTVVPESERYESRD